MTAEFNMLIISWKWAIFLQGLGKMSQEKYQRNKNSVLLFIQKQMHRFCFVQLNLRPNTASEFGLCNKYSVKWWTTSVFVNVGVVQDINNFNRRLVKPYCYVLIVRQQIVIIIIILWTSRSLQSVSPSTHLSVLQL